MTIPFLGFVPGFGLQRRVQGDHGIPPAELLEEKMQERCQALKYKIFERKTEGAPELFFLVLQIVSMNFSKSKIQMGKKRTFLDFFFISMQYLLKDSLLPNGSNHNFSHFLANSVTSSFNAGNSRTAFE